MKEIQLFDSREKKKKILKGKFIKIYSCGPTLYNNPHIGNMRAYVFADTLNRTLKNLSRKVNHIINLTDVGHLSDDGDDGEDKIEIVAKRKKESAKEIVKRYEEQFYKDLISLNIDIKKYKFPKASENIKEQLDLIKEIEKKGYTYRINDGIYFDTTKYKKYGAFPLSNDKVANSYRRVDEKKDKKNFRDFALWKFSKKDDNRLQEWNSFYGKGFPGWHIECSAMAMKFLGENINIHTGGVDHKQIHHNNEIAQSESVTEKKLADIWMHCEFLNEKGEKLSKSLNNSYTIDELKEKGINPLAVRYLFLQTSYRHPINFSFKDLLGCQTALNRINDYYKSIKRNSFYSLFFKLNKSYKENIDSAISNDLNTAKLIAIINNCISDKKLKDIEKKKIIEYCDKFLGILFNIERKEIPAEVVKIMQERERARAEKNWQLSDKLRDEIKDKGYTLVDKQGESYII